jgi:hypothetical protein
MPSLLTSTDEVCVSGALSDLFDTFSQNIIINKEPKKTLIAGTTNTPSLPGYSRRRENLSYTYDPVSGVYPAIVDQRNSLQRSEVSANEKFRYPEGVIMIKVKDDAKNFINNGVKTENIIANGQMYNVVSEPEPKKAFGWSLWVIELKKTK